MTTYHILGNQVLMVAGPGKADVVADDEPVAVDVETPTISALTPDTAALGGDDFDLVVTGTGFNELTKIVFNGHDEPTKLLSPTECSTGVKPSIFTVPEALPVHVRNGSVHSNSLDFTFSGAEADEERVEGESEEERKARRSSHSHRRGRR